MIHVRCILFLLLAALIGGCSDSVVDQPSDAGTSLFSDELISFPIPEGGSVKPAAESSYLVFFDEEMFYLMLRGEAEPEDFGRQRTEAARADAQSKSGKPIDDGESVVAITDISETTRHEVDGDPVYLFIHSANAESKEENWTGYNTVGFGSLNGNAIWFQHTSGNQAEHPSSILSFLESVTFQ